MRSGWAAGQVWLLVALVVAAVLTPAPADGHDGLHRAGLVVRHGDGRVTYAYVVFREEELRGIELLRRSGLPLVTVGFGGLGEAVCALEGEGCPTGECRKNLCQTSPDAPYWQPCAQAAPGEWRVWRLGASSARIRDGEVYGWAWGDCAQTLPAVSISDVARLVGTTDPPVASSTDEVPSATAKTIYPPGVEPEREPGRQGLGAYATAVAILALVAAAGLYAVRRTRAPQ